MFTRIPPAAGGCTQVAGSLLDSTSGSNCAKCQTLCFQHLATCVQPPAAGGIYKASACVKTNGRRQISGVSTAENASLDLWGTNGSRSPYCPQSSFFSPGHVSKEP